VILLRANDPSVLIGCVERCELLDFAGDQAIDLKTTLTYRLRLPTANADIVVGQVHTSVPGTRTAPELTQRPAPGWAKVVELPKRRLDRSLTRSEFLP
jgi:hypothetical protein